MANAPATLPGVDRAPRSRAATTVRDEPRWARFALIGAAVAFLALMIAVPIANIIYEAGGKGWSYYLESLVNSDSKAALILTLKVAALVVPANAMFGLAAAWATTKFDFPGKAIFVTLIDLPIAVSPVVAGLIFILVFGRNGYLGPWLLERDIRVVFAFPGIAIATAFVTFPLVARALIPVMEEAGRTDEEAAITLGASGLQTFWHVTLPNVKWGLVNGIVLCNARAMGEFGAVAVVSGKITGKTDTLPLRIEKLDKAYDTTGAFALATLLVGLALVTLVLKAVIDWRTGRAK